MDFNLQLAQRLVNQLDELNKRKHNIRCKILTLHLWFELIINSFCEVFFINNAKENLPINFSAKYRIVKSIGFLTEDICKRIERINEIRNKFTHNYKQEEIEFDLNDLGINFPSNSSLDDKFQLLAVETILELNEEISNFLEYRADLIKKGSEIKESINRDKNIK